MEYLFKIGTGIREAKEHGNKTMLKIKNFEACWNVRGGGGP
jgi:hypothetical protein